MSADQLIAELKALPLAERRQVVHAMLLDEASWQPEKPQTEETPSFTESWKGLFSLPEPVPGEARLAYLLDRFSK